MNRFILLIFLFTAPLSLMAQRLSEYNKKGDEALLRHDVADAKMWFEEGISYCDNYSIEKLTAIWIENESVRSSMRSLMTKCLNCLNILATENDTTSMARLIIYYDRGIGTPQSPELSSYWKERLASITQEDHITKVLENNLTDVKERSSSSVKLMVGYNYSPSAPYGMTFGLIGKRWGGYIRLKSNMIFGKTTATCNNSEIINYVNDSYYQFDKDRVSRFGITGGLMLQFLPWLYSTLGVGYGERELQWHATVYSYTGNDKTELWCENTSSSYKGIETEADMIVKMGKRFYFSVGCNSINLKFADLNTGLGLIF